ncbi:hypothetical protein H6P81_011299 [Aristolochia fimbriata]|uniref:Glucose-methanol-choline oxidoreductase N-terminal domain-containing protein n=1 Tax=Aristolochia fimbriata TaxID=158543 RepID=A0AAV7ERV9_ARIFI|nr:hypothetical protein H6P81_011299 [Aristolochia fimbriata]
MYPDPVPSPLRLKDLAPIRYQGRRPINILGAEASLRHQATHPRHERIRSESADSAQLFSLSGRGREGERERGRKMMKKTKYTLFIILIVVLAMVASSTSQYQEAVLVPQATPQRKEFRRVAPLSSPSPMEIDHRRLNIQGCFTVFVLFITGFSSSCTKSTEGARVPFITSDVKAISGRSFDYIIVGGGTSGCPLAATLSEKFTVLLVERGGSSFGNPLVEDKKNYGFPLIDTDEFSSIAQPFVSEEGVENIRGRVLGGSSAINGGFYSRASEEEVERLGWDRELVKESYEWVESKIVFEPWRLTPWQFVTMGSYIAAKILPFNGFSVEHIQGTKIGGSIYDNHGKRHTSADLLLAGNFKKLTVLVNATVKSVIFHHDQGRHKSRAMGIRFMDSNGDPNHELHQAYLKRPEKSKLWGEVILSAGALGSPQILMLSGIGPQQNLNRHNIKPLLHLPQVGKNIQDNPSIAIRFNLSKPLQGLRPDPPQVVGIADKFQIIIQSLILPTSPTSKMFTVAAKVARPESRGVVELSSNDPRKNPSVRFNYLGAERDLRECVRMSWLVDRVVQSKPVEEFTGKKQEGFVLGGENVRSKLRDICRKNVRTYYHFHGGCVVGSVVDEDYRVYGVSGLRVVDGSTLLFSPGTNPMASLLMLGRYQGKKIINERQEG